MMKMRVLILSLLFLSIFVVACSQQPTMAPARPAVDSNQSSDGTLKQDTNTTEQTTPPTSSGYTLVDVAKHNSQNSCWTAVGGGVYDVTSYIDRHPGGPQNVLRLCGKDGTSLFEGKHGGMPKPEAALAGLKIGTLN